MNNLREVADRHTPLGRMIARGDIQGSPGLRIAKNIARDQQRLRMAGITPPPPERRDNLLIRALDIIDRPGAAIRAAVKTAATPEKEPILPAMAQAFRGQKRVTGEDVLDALDLAPQSRLGRAVAGIAAEVVLDPTTWMTFGLAPGIRGAKAIARQGVKPERALHLGTFLGFTQPLAKVDITRPLEQLGRTTQKGLDRATFGQARRLQDALGKLFVADYIPRTVDEALRPVLAEGKDLVRVSELRAPTAADIGAKDVLRQYTKVQGATPTDRVLASYVLAEADTPIMKDLTKLKLNLNDLHRKEQSLLKSFSRTPDSPAIKDKLRQVQSEIEKDTGMITHLDAALKKQRQDVLDSVGAQAFTPESKALAREARNQMDLSHQMLLQAGVPIKDLGTPGEFVLGMPSLDALGRFDAGPTAARIVLGEPLRYLGPAFKPRQLGELHDISLVAATHRALAEQAAVMYRMRRDLSKLGTNIIRPPGAKGQIPQGWKKIRGNDIPLFQGYAAHPELYDSLQRLYQVVGHTDQGMESFRRAWGAATGAFKKITTAYSPRFHIINALGNVVLNAIDGIDPRVYPEIVGLMRGTSEYVEFAGKRIKADRFRRMFRELGLEGQGMFRLGATQYNVLSEALESAGRMGLAPRKKGAALEEALNAPRNLGTITDSYFRMANFLHHLRQGAAPAEAAARTKAALYDYTRLTPFEQQIAFWAVPFYAWTRNNMPAMIRLLINRPGVIMSAARGGEVVARAEDIPQEDQPRWMRDALAIPIGRDVEGRIRYFNPMMPFAEISRVVMPGEWREGLRETLSMFHPAMKIPAEIALNRQLHTDRPILTPGAPHGHNLNEVMKYLARQIVPIREGMLAHDYATETPAEAARRPTRRIPFLGSLYMKVDPENQQLATQREYRRKLRDVIQGLERQGVKVPWPPRERP